MAADATMRYHESLVEARRQAEHKRQKRKKKCHRSQSIIEILLLWYFFNIRNSCDNFTCKRFIYPCDNLCINLLSMLVQYIYIDI